ncbi:MAG: hypothetical protein RL095_844 [Verrucomicrobiota bacterium]|jgi:excisionase family DNA binding protein
MAIARSNIQVRVSTVKLLTKLMRSLVEENVVGSLEAQVIAANLKQLAERGELLAQTQEVRLLTSDQVAEMLALGKSNFDKLLREGRLNLKRIQIGTSVRFRSDDVQRLILGGGLEGI